MQSRVIFSGVGKTRDEMREALEAGIGCFNVESEANWRSLSEVAMLSGGKAAGEHPGESERGPQDPSLHFHRSERQQVWRGARTHPADLPARSQPARPARRGHRLPHRLADHRGETPYLDAMDRVLDLVDAIEAAGIPIGTSISVAAWASTTTATRHRRPMRCGQACSRLDARGYGDRQLMIEPGRSLVGNAGVCLTEVLYLKPGEQKNFCIIDAAMNDLPRPAMYQAFHQIVAPRAPRG
jgi:diaminopimelate decarboxylase